MSLVNNLDTLLIIMGILGMHSSAFLGPAGFEIPDIYHPRHLLTNDLEAKTSPKSFQMAHDSTVYVAQAKPPPETDNMKCIPISLLLAAAA